VRDRRALQATLEAYGTAFLLEMTQPSVIAVHRLAILEAESSSEVGRALNTFGREATSRTVSEFVREAQAAGLLGKGDPSTIARQFMSLLWAGTMLALLLRAEQAPDERAAAQRAREAATALLRLYPPPQ